MINKFLSNSAQDTKKFAAQLAQKLRGGEVIALSGDLGSGKTTFVQGLAAGLGIKEKITSPTFLLLKQYEVTGHPGLAPRSGAGQSPVTSLVHIDAYRLQNEQDAIEIGITDYLSQPHNICVIEWPEIIKKILPKKTILIKFKHFNENSREIITPRNTNLTKYEKNINPTNKIKAIIFDFDQVISDSLPLGVKTHRKLAKILQLRVPTTQEIQKIWDEPWVQIINKLWPEIEPKLLKKEFNKRFHWHPPLFAGVIETLNYLHRKGIKIGILSSSDQGSFDLTLKKHKINHYFNFIIATGESYLHKPDKRVFRPVARYLENHHINLKETLYVGDSPPKDWKIAQKIGIPFLAVTTGYYKKPDFIKAGLSKNRIVGSIQNLPAWIRKNYDLSD